MQSSLDQTDDDAQSAPTLYLCDSYRYTIYLRLHTDLGVAGSYITRHIDTNENNVIVAENGEIEDPPCHMLKSPVRRYDTLKGCNNNGDRPFICRPTSTRTENSPTYL